MWLLWLVLGALTAYLGLHYSRNNQPVAPLACSEDFKNEKDLSSLPSRNLTLPKIPRAGLAIVTSSGQGYSRDIVYKLANRGLHVLSCVKSKQEERSFAFDKHKGIEAIQASLDKPVDIARLIYRSNEIKRDLNRTLAAVVINVVDLFPLGKHSTSKFSSGELENGFRMMMRSPYRLIEAFMENIKIQEQHYGNMGPDFMGRVVLIIPNCKHYDGVAKSICYSIFTFYDSLFKEYLPQRIFISTVEEIDVLPTEKPLEFLFEDSRDINEDNGISSSSSSSSSSSFGYSMAFVSVSSTSSPSSYSVRAVMHNLFSNYPFPTIKT